MNPRTVDRDDRRETILAAALRAFSLQGYADTTLKQIAESAGLGSAAHLYYYFPKKEQLFADVLVRYVAVDPLFAEGELDDPPEVALDRYCRRYLAQFGDAERLLAFRLMNIEAGRLLTLGLDLSAVNLAHVLDDLVAYFERQRELGTIRDVAPEHVARTVLGILNLQIQAKATPFTAVPSDDDVVRNAIDIVFHGILE